MAYIILSISNAPLPEKACYNQRMKLAGISLQYFRNYGQKSFLFPKQTTVILGENAQGKTSILEAIVALSMGESFRAEKVDEMIQFDQEIGRLKGKVIYHKTAEDGDDSVTSDSEEEVDLDLTLTRGMVSGKKVQTRLYAVNGVSRRKKDFVGHFFTVAFRPEDMRLVEGSPSRRREFIDTVLTIVDPDYAASLKTYEDGLKRRNRLLQQINEGFAPVTVLSYYNNLLLKHGEIVQRKRSDFFGTFNEVVFPVAFELHYQPSVMSAEHLAEHAAAEIAAGHTLIGPHKDDFTVELLFGGELRNVALFGSRGQQRLAVLWLKVSELEFIKSQTHHLPVLLLDDILSELDEGHRHDVLSLLQHGQSIVTTTEEKIVEEIQQYVTELDIVKL